MIRQRKKPYSLLCYEALFRRLKNKYRQSHAVHQDYANVLSGYLGERQVDYILSATPTYFSHAYQGLRLKNHQHYFQMDTVLLSNKFILIIEIKNWKGVLTYHSNLKNITQIYNNTEKSYRNPITQVEAHKLQLEYWLQQMLGIYGVPIETLVVISDSATILKNPQEDPQFYNTVIYADNLPSKLDELWKKYPKSSLTNSQLREIHSHFLKYNDDYQPDLIRLYNLDKSHLIHGIECAKCGQYPMSRVHGKWYCIHCSFTDKLAHERVILDYFLLFKPTITNKDCREFLQIESPKVAYSLLQSMKLNKSGEHRGREYHAPKLEDYPQHSHIPWKMETTLNVTF